MKKVKRKVSFFTRLLLVLNAATAISLLLAYLAPVVDPRTFWPVAFFGLAYPPLLLLNGIFIVYWLFRRSKWVLISTLAILVGWNVLLNNIGFSFSGHKDTKDTGRLRVMTYNVHNFQRYGEEKDSSTRRGILRIIKETQPDVIGIPEYFSRSKGVYAMTDSIKAIFKNASFHFESIIATEREFMGLAIFSAYPMVAKGTVSIANPNNGNQCIYADIKYKNGIFRFYSVHLQSIRFDPKDYEYLDTVTKKGKADLHSTRRLASKLKQAFIKRAAQVFIIKAHAAQCPYPYIIAGDFNDTPTSFAVNQMAKGLKNTFREKGSGLGRTYNGDFPNYQIDYVMASPVFDVTGYNIIQQKLSDHYPVYADMVLK